jgi:hypothetical protein
MSTSTAETVFNNDTECFAELLSMSSVRTPLVALGMFSLHSEGTLLPALQHNTESLLPRTNPYVVFEASLPAQVQLMAAGGGIAIHLRVGLPKPAAAKEEAEIGSSVHGDDFVKFMDAMNFRIAVRLAGLPGDPDVFEERLESTSSDKSEMSPNAFILSSRDAVVTDRLSEGFNSGTDDDDTSSRNSPIYPTASPRRYQTWASANIVERAQKSSSNSRTYTWVITRAALPNLFATSLGASEGVPLFLRVSREPLAPTSRVGHAQSAAAVGIWHGSSRVALTQASEIAENPSFDSKLEIAASLVFEPCPQGSCEHGQCFTQSGDVPAYSCECR